MGFIKTCEGRIFNTNCISEIKQSCFLLDGEEIMVRIYFDLNAEQITIMYAQDEDDDIAHNISSRSFVDFSYDTQDSVLDSASRDIFKIEIEPKDTWPERYEQWLREKEQWSKEIKNKLIEHECGWEI